ncbi:Crp/Fnr family transcriptional regulator [uncultured Roseobacter sp.]|uniref:Crp/Fnr family transcriptional regulator n=1 Tax=uncultured Roseobacter sp. TaxID=114847 RepID=UPI00260F74BF|nr:Crp/Fnr family transcriptional regulator [uncultured Roseobacter sp.]
MASEANKSCLVQKLSHYAELDEEAIGHLERLEREERSYDEQQDIYLGGDRRDDLHVVKKGWLYSYTDLPDGRRQIVRLHHPGDIVGFEGIAFHHATTSVRAAEPVVLCPFPKSGLDVVFESSPKLTALLFTLAVREQVIFVDLIRAMGRMSARERLAYLFLNLLAKLRITNTDMTDTCRLPLTQTEIGDVLGLSNVYVSKTISRLENDGFISRKDGNVTVLREDDLANFCDFYDRYSDMDVSWFPQS